MIDRVLTTLPLPPDADILEIGAGAGGNYCVLSKYGNVTMIETNEEAREYASFLTCSVVLNGFLPGGMTSVQGKKFDLICLLDVLEHIQNDENDPGRIGR